LVDIVNTRYGKLDPLTVTREVISTTAWGMTLDYSVPGAVTVRMDNYVSNLSEEAPEDTKGTAGDTRGRTSVYCAERRRAGIPR
jgi:hypothetical protein